jgi:predicted DNA-binding transcriptional regulator
MNKMEHTKKHRIGIVDFSLVDQGLSHLEALVYQYVQRFEKNKRPCFASISHIAAELRLSEPSTKRYIKRLIKLGMLRETTKGRGRYLNTTGIKMIPMNGIKLSVNGIKLIGDRDQIDPCDRDQNDPLPIKVLPIEDTNKKIPVAGLSPQEQFKLELLAMGVNYDDLPE